MKALAEQGWDVRILARRDPIDPLWRNLTPELIPGDLRDREALARLCDGADVVVHNAGLVKARDRAAFDAVNVEGAARVAEAAAHAPHVVLVSSLVARAPHLSHYSASKAAGETAMAERLGRRLTVARPCAIYGPGDRELLPVFQAASRSPVLPILSRTARVTMIHVADAAAQIAALAALRPEGRIAALSDGRPDGYLWSELMVAAAQACGRSPRMAPVPAALVRALGVTNDFRAFTGVTPMLTSAKARELLHLDWSVSPAERVEGLPTPRYDLAAGFADAVAWYRSAAWLKH